MWLSVQRGDGGGGPSEPPFVALTDDEAERCLLTMKDTQHQAVFSLMVDLGLGPGELLGEGDVIRGLFIQDINSRAMLLKVHHRTSRKEPYSVREVPLTTRCISAIQNFLFSGGRNLHDTGKLFDITDRRWRQVLLDLSDKTGIEKSITTVMLRRTAIIKMLRTRLHPDEIRRRMGILRTREELVVYAVGFVLNDPITFENMIKQAMCETLVAGPRPAMVGSGFSAGRSIQ